MSPSPSAEQVAARRQERVKQAIRNWPGFPKEPVVFRDVMPLLGDPEVYDLVLSWFCEQLPPNSPQPVKILSPESRGFLFGIGAAVKAHCGFVPARKPGKLPGPLLTEKFELEYGEDSLSVQEGALRPGDRVFIIDDVLATGGTIAALQRIVTRCGAELVGVACLINVRDVPKLHPVCAQVRCWISYD